MNKGPTDHSRRDTVKQKRKKPTWKRLLAYTGIGIAAVVVVAAGLGFYEYQRLQPKNHFKNLPTVAPTGTVTAANTTFSTISSKSTASKPTSSEAPGVFNVLLFGSDARPTGSGSGLSVADSHTDSIILIHVNLNTHQYNMLSIPRDTRVYMPGFGHTKITSVQILAQTKLGPKQGTLYAVQFISKFTGVPINYYAETNYWGLQAMVNAIGGITMNLPFPVTLTHPWYTQDAGMKFSAGPHFLNGRLVAEVVHERFSVPGTDYGRQKLQAAALKGIAKAVMQPSNLTKLPQLSRSVSQYLMDTNMTPQDFISIGLGVKGDFHSSQIHYYQVSGKGELIYNDPLGAMDDEIILNMNQLKQIIHAHF
ncbi:LCP family protein [Alicyclobacillus sp. ALC3]|uniref:LCP family protein n=1 Tax=Alicyclobacillus sp. ALC3 TaxID=2796143 RepID=UPI002379B81A|nr:LCP family protein [Alicyclobacillus sp. ALC3]WDL95270.1 LCP family protein [Alicyclobacillus sp. ALC3]